MERTSCAASEPVVRVATFNRKWGEHRGVCLLSEFVVEAREEQHTEEERWRWEQVKEVPGDFNHVQLRLQPYCTYRFRVIAINEIGHSNASAPSEHHSTLPAGR